MTFRHTSIAFLVTLSLATYVWIFENPFQVPQDSSRDQRQLLGEITPDAVSAIEIHQGEQTLRLAQAQGDWHILSPITYPAEATKIQALLQNLTTLTYQSAISPTPNAPPTDSDPYGLDTPTRSVILEFDRSPLTVTVGLPAPGKIHFVKRSDSDQIFTVATSDLASINATTDHWRDPRVFPHPTSRIESIQASSPLGQVLLRRSPQDRSWEMETPVSKARIDESFLTFFIQQLSELRVSTFPNQTPASPQTSLTLELEGQPPYELQIHSPTSENPALAHAFLPNSNTAITLPTAFGDLIEDPVKAFRSPYVLDSEFAFDSLEFTGDRNFKLIRDVSNGRWWLGKIEQQAADDRLVAQLLLQLRELRITDFVTDELQNEADFGLNAPSLRLMFSNSNPNSNPNTESEAPSSLLVRFGAKIRNHLMAHRSDESSVYAVPYGAVMQLPQRPFQLQDRQLWQIDETAIFRLTVHKTESPPQIWHRDDARWQSNEQLLNEVESAALQAVVTALAQVKVESWTHQGLDIKERFGIGKKERLVIETQTESDEGSYQVEFGSISPRGHRYAMIAEDGIETVFEFPGPLYVQLHEVLRMNPPEQ